MKTQGLTAMHERILKAITNYSERNGYPPSVREIGKAVGISSTSSVADLDYLEKHGRISRVPMCPRTIRVLSEAES